MFRIDVDDRENECAPLFDVLSGRRSVTTKVKRLTTGDFAAWMSNELKILIERKTWNDLASSMKDGRLEKQLDSMNLVRTQTGCAVIVMIEGRPGASHGHIEMTSLRTKLDHIMLGGRAHVIFTSSTNDTVQRVFELVDHIVYDVTVQSGAVPVDILTHAKERTAEQMLIDMFCAVPQISMNTATLLAKNGWMFLDLYETTAEILATLVYPSGNTMPIARARKITEALGTKACWIKVLERVTGVTKKTGQTIMDAEADPYKWTLQTLQDLEKSKLRKLGPVVAARIIKMISFKS